MFNICPDIKLSPFHITLNKTIASRTQLFGDNGQKSENNFESSFKFSALDKKYKRYKEFYTDLYSASVPFQIKADDKTTKASSQSNPELKSSQKSSQKQSSSLQLSPGISVTSMNPADLEPEDFETFQPLRAKRKQGDEAQPLEWKKPRKSLAQKYAQSQDCPDDPIDDPEEVEAGIEEVDSIIAGEEDPLADEDFEDALDEREEESDGEEYELAPSVAGKTDYSWLNNPKFPQIDIADPMSSIVKAKDGADALQVLEATPKNSIQSVMLKTSDFRAAVRDKLSQQDRQLSEYVYAEPRYCFNSEMAKRKAANAAVVTHQRMPLYINRSVQRAKYTRHLLRRTLLQERAARLLGLKSYSNSQKDKIIVFWGTGGMKKFKNRYLPGRKCHPASKELLHYVQMIATVYVTHEKGTSVHCSNCEQRVVRRRTADQDIVTCAHCHLVINGDVNAAINILKIGLIMAINRGRFPMQFTL
ncbi:hypothetical protein MIR68_004929 [Amoeboaphelidium protococcarum]|nr:hypothetical protein MIR68_004929 [Amoeboaphelidium protococcarum]